jgi:hypothetical protein
MAPTRPPDPTAAEVRLVWTGGGPVVIRGRLAWLLIKIATRGAQPLAEDVDRLAEGKLELNWGTNGNVKAQTLRTYHWPGEVA